MTKNHALYRFLLRQTLLFVSMLAFYSVHAASLTLAGTIPLRDVSGRIDHFALDAARHRLFVAALGNDTVEVIDLSQKKRWRTLSGFSEPQGIAIAPEINRVLIANGEDGVCHIYNSETLLETGSIDLKDDADNARYDPASRLFWVGHESGALAAIDAERNRVVTDIKLAAHPESFQLETRGHRIFVNVPEAHEVTVIDREKNEVIGHWPLQEASSNFPMALDEAHHRLFVGCRHPAKLLVLNTGNGALVASVDIVGDNDDLWLDGARHRIYASGGSGSITVIAQNDADHYSVLENFPTAGGARTSFFDAETGKLYVAVPHHLLQKAAEIRIYHTAGDKR